MMMTTTTMTTMTIWWYVYINDTCFEVHPFFLAPYFWCPDPVRRAKLVTGTYSARISRLATLQDTDTFQHSNMGIPCGVIKHGDNPPSIGGFHMFNGTIIELNERLWEMFHPNVLIARGYSMFLGHKQAMFVETGKAYSIATGGWESSSCNPK
jgi:hypothetical protein